MRGFALHGWEPMLSLEHLRWQPAARRERREKTNQTDKLMRKVLRNATLGLVVGAAIGSMDRIGRDYGPAATAREEITRELDSCRRDLQCVSKKHRSLSLIYHPDKGGSDLDQALLNELAEERKTEIKTNNREKQYRPLE
jgi:hypothetical protein